MATRLNICTIGKVSRVVDGTTKATGKKYRAITWPAAGRYNKDTGKTDAAWITATGYANDAGEFPGALRDVQKGSVVMVTGQLIISSYVGKNDGAIHQSGEMPFATFDFVPTPDAPVETEVAAPTEVDETEEDPFADQP